MRRLFSTYSEQESQLLGEFFLIGRFWLDRRLAGQSGDWGHTRADRLSADVNR
jgi:hypothetical protein